MFPHRYFACAYWPGRYWPPGCEEADDRPRGGPSHWIPTTAYRHIWREIEEEERRLAALRRQERPEALQQAQESRARVAALRDRYEALRARREAEDADIALLVLSGGFSIDGELLELEDALDRLDEEQLSLFLLLH